MNLREERLNRGFTLDVAAEKIGVPKQTLHRAELGLHTPRPAAALKIAKFYGTKVTDLWPVEPVEQAS